MKNSTVGSSFYATNKDIHAVVFSFSTSFIVSSFSILNLIATESLFAATAGKQLWRVKGSKWWPYAM